MEEAKAKEAGNSSKARRMGRIVKQYQDALKLHAAGRPIPRGDLPDPPGTEGKYSGHFPSKKTRRILLTENAQTELIKEQVILHELLI